MTGRARGRARGRGSQQPKPQEQPGPGAPSRAPPPQQQPPQQPPRAPQSAPVHQPGPNGNNGNNGTIVKGSGRASVRGGSRGEPRPGEGPPTRQMAGMSLGGAQGRPRRGDYIPAPHTRPAHVVNKTGDYGAPIKLYTNTFAMSLGPGRAICQYHVHYNPPIESRGMRMRLINEQKELWGPTKIFDGMILYLGRKLDQPKTEFVGQSREGEPIQVTVEFTNEIQPGTQSYMQILNIMMRRNLGALGMKLIGKNYFMPSSKVVEQQYGYEILPGYTTAIHSFDGGVQLIADVTHKILRPHSVLNIMYDMQSRNRGGNFLEMCTKKLVGEIVMTSYNNKTYRIDDINWEVHPTDSFKQRDGTDITFLDYYTKHHDIRIEDMQQPLLISRPKKKDEREGAGDLLLVPELCRLTGLSDEARADFQVMKNLAVFTRVSPQGRRDKMLEFLKNLKRNEEVKKSMEGMGLQFADDLTKLRGRHLGCEKLWQGDKQYSYKMLEADWSREMRGHKLKSCPPLENWVVIYARQSEGHARDLVETLMRVSGAMGMRLGQPSDVKLGDGYTQSFISALRQNVTDRTQLVVCVLPSNKKDLYDAIKKFCCCEKPVPSQCIVQRTLNKKQMLMSVCTKVAVQMNCKLGGEVWAVDIPPKGLMVIGIDTYHDSAMKGRSVGAFVASTNNTLTKYYSRCCFQVTGQELMNELSLCMRDALKHYQAVNQALPERVFIYRDGVGDGQVDHVASHEVPQVTKCFQSVGTDYNPKCTVIIVTKRINNRFFEPQQDGLGNPPPGTVVDVGVTRPEWYDFFLVSQSVRQGTVSPTHYNIVYDSSGYNPNLLQRLTYKLCHLYYNWPGTIRVPAPCQYAHKLAFLVGQSLHKDFGMELSDKLFFL